MDSKEIHNTVVEKFNARSIEFGQIKASVEALCVGILVDCKDIVVEIQDAKAVVNIIIDEIGLRVNLGLLEPIFLSAAKGIFEKYGDTPQLEKWFSEIKSKALDIINSNIPEA